MKTKGQFKSLGTRTVNGRRVAVAEHKLMRFFRIGTCNIAAVTLDEAMEKFVACKAKQSAVSSQQSAVSGQQAEC